MMNEKTSIFSDLKVFDILESTQDTARDFAEKGAGEGLAVLARSQTAGRGRLNRQWLSREGNIYLSFILRPDIETQNIGHLSFVISLGIASFLEEKIGGHTKISLKWPNDVLVNGSKISGLLLESGFKKEGRLDFIIVGIGLNVKHAPDYACCLGDFVDVSEDLEEIVRELLTEISSYYQSYLKNGFSVIRESWLKKAHGIGKEITVNMPSKQLFGIFHGIDQNGVLILKTDQEESPIHMGDVFFGTSV